VVSPSAAAAVVSVLGLASKLAAGVVADSSTGAEVSLVVVSPALCSGGVSPPGFIFIYQKKFYLTKIQSYKL